MPRESSNQRQTRAKKVIAALKKTHPDAKLALNFSTPLELLVALILAAQCRDDLVNEVTATLFKNYRTLADWTKLREEDVRRINFYRGKARSIRAAATMVTAVPRTLDELLELPGVGRKTANAVLANAFGQPAIVVDTHTWRLSQRLGFTKHDDPSKIEADLVQIVPKKDWVKFCHLLQFHGRRVCTARSPNCPNCSINKLCPWPGKTKRP